MAIETSIREFLEQVAVKHGEEYRNQMDVRHAGGRDIVITTPEGEKSIVSLGNLQLMTRTMKRHASARLNA
ncbi:MAG TPA: hypothetical protein VNI58_06480 [Mariprofundaceae bacterium]|nr:hypothetical protein [Mariprofundaceae bacterium]